MSLTAGIVIVLVLVARLPLKKAPKIFSYALWAVVLFRLICPVSFSSQLSVFGLLPAAAKAAGSGATGRMSYIPSDIVHTEFPRVNLPLPGINEAINSKLPQGEEQLVADPLEAPMAVGTLLWLFGCGAMLMYSAISLIYLRRKLVGAGRLRDNIYLADHIASPFVIGVIRPRIYLPSTLPEEERSYVVLHEQTHIRRLDHIVKMLAYLALAIHWFNPLVWVAFVCAAKDMEMSCDERVLKQMGGTVKGAYGASLLSLATGRRLINGSPLAFGEGNLKGRIKNIMNFKKPATWVVIVSIMIVVALSICLAANNYSVSLNAANITGANLTTEGAWYPLIKGKSYKLNEEDINFIVALVNRSSEKRIPDDYRPTYGGLYETYFTIQIAIAGADGGSDGLYRLQLYHHDDWSIAHGESEYRLALVNTDGDKMWQLSYDACYQLKGWLEQNYKRLSFSAENKAYEAADMSADESEAWQKRLQEDIPGAGSYEVGGIYSKDFDVNGEKDLVVLLRAAGSQPTQAYLCVYMNDSPIYTQAFDGTLTAFAFMQYPFCGDIDNDGCPEVIYTIATGGNGGAGSSVKGVLKYKDHTLVPMELPGDKSKSFTENNDIGYQVKVLFGSGENRYRAVCEGLGKTVEFQAQNAVTEGGTKFRSYIKVNEEIGANCRGYCAFSVVNRNGRNCLYAEEYLYGEAGISHGVGFATFLIEWDGGGTPYVSEFGVSDKSILEMTEPADSSDMQAPVAKADVNQDGKDENICLDKSRMETTFDVTILISDQSGNELWRESLNTSHAGWGQIYLCNYQGAQYLLRYTPQMGQGYCTYVYSLFSPEADGKEKVLQTMTLEFDINGSRELDARQMTDFADEVNALLKASTLLVSSDGGAWRFGPASAEPFYERYSWLDGTPELFGDSDSLETKLEKYSDWAIKNREPGDLLYYDYSIAQSNKFSQAEIRAAVESVTDKFKDFKGCTLTKLWYDEEKSNGQVDSYMAHGHGSVNGVGRDNVIVLYSDFTVDSSGADGSMNPNSTYTDWCWILIRDGSKEKWRVDDWGY
jgi:beta-lactamase regulating signal transducer with metallopeptidase domain